MRLRAGCHVCRHSVSRSVPWSYDIRNIAFRWPVASHEVIANSIAATTTTPGFTIQAELYTGNYPTSVKILDGQITELSASGTPNGTPSKPVTECRGCIERRGRPDRPVATPCLRTDCVVVTLTSRIDSEPRTVGRPRHHEYRSIARKLGAQHTAHSCFKTVKQPFKSCHEPILGGRRFSGNLPPEHRVATVGEVVQEQLHAFHGFVVLIRVETAVAVAPVQGSLSGGGRVSQPGHGRPCPVPVRTNPRCTRFEDGDVAVGDLALDPHHAASAHGNLFPAP